MSIRESLKMIRIGQPAAKPRTGERSTTKGLHAADERITSDWLSVMVDYLLG